MATRHCKEQGTKEWNELVSLIGEHEVWKEVAKYEEFDNPIQKSLESLRVPVSKKKEFLKAMSEQYHLKTEDEDGAPMHKYVDKTGRVFPSVSDVLDTIPGLQFRGEDSNQGDDQGNTYADVGTKIHSLWEDVINSKNPIVVLDNMKLKHKDIPSNYIAHVIGAVNLLKQQGTLVSESRLGYKGKDPDDEGVVGTSDIILFKDDGTVHIYDIKTVHQTQEKKRKKWNVQEDNAYKAKRYSTQAVFYGELASRAIGQPISSYNIIPAEIGYNDVTDLSKGISDIKPVEPQNVATYDQLNLARLHVDTYFGNKSPQSYEFTGIKGVSSRIVSSLTGLAQDELSRTTDRLIEAEDVYNQTYAVTNSGESIYEFGGQIKKLKGDNKSDHLNQILRESIDPLRDNGTDVLNSTLNYVESGTDIKLDKRNIESVNRTILDEYRNSNFTAKQLSSIEGFQDKEGWIILQNGKRVDLLYTGNDLLNNKLNIVSPNGKISRSNNILAHLDNDPNYRFPHKMDATVLNAKKVEAVVIAAELLRADADINIGKMAISSEQVTKEYAAIVNPIQVLDVLQGAADQHKIGDGKVDDELVELLDLDRSRFSIDAIDAYIDYIKTMEFGLDPDIDTDIAEGLTQLRAKQLKSEEIEDVILEEIRNQVNNLKEGDNISQELYLLSQVYFEIQGVSIWDNPIGKFESWAKTRNDLPGEILSFINSQTSNQLGKLREEFFEGYKKSSLQKLDTFMKKSSNGVLDNIADRTFSQTSKYYEPLFVRKSMTMQDGTVKEVRLPELLRPTSKEYKALPDHAKEYHTYLVDQFAIAAKKAGMKDWDPYLLPIMKSSTANSLYKLTNREMNMRTAFDNWWGGLQDNFEFVGQENKGVYRANNWFQKQTTLGGRAELSGYVGNEVRDQKAFEGFETNMEVLLDMFTMNAVRVKHMDKLSKMYASAYSVFKFQAMNLIDPEFINNATFVQNMNTVIVQGKGLDSGTTFDKIVNMSSMVVSSMTLGYNFKSAFAVGLGQEYLLASRTLANTFIGKGASLKDYAKAGKFMVKNRALTLQLIDTYGLVDMDSTSITNGLRQGGNKSYFKLKSQFSMLRYGDQLSKGHYMIAEMIADGSIDAYSLVDGKMNYDETKDPRFKGPDGQALKKTIKLQMEKDGNLDVNGNMTRGWDFKEAQRFSHKLVRIFGGYDRDTRAMGGFTSFGKLFLMHKNFLPAVYGRLLRAKHVSEVEGEYVKTIDAEGNPQWAWEGNSSEGLLISLVALAQNLTKMKDQRVPLEPHQIDNLKVIVGDLTMMLFALGVASAIAGLDDDDSAWAELAYKVAYGGLRDLRSSYDVSNIQSIFRPVVIDVAMKTTDDFVTLMTGDVQGLYNLLQAPAVIKQTTNLFELVTDTE